MNPNVIYTSIFSDAAISGRIKVNYTSSTSRIVDDVIATKSSNSNVVKGKQLD